MAQSYHHGDLRNALVEAGVALAREGGPGAIVLREAARRVGVSQTAAYRHFDSLPALVDAVALVALGSMGDVMRGELVAATPTGDVQLDALNQLRAVGRGYVWFALDQPGLFAAAFASPKDKTDPKRPFQACAHEDQLPDQLLEGALDTLIAAGLLDGAKRPAAATTAWAGVHGLSVLLLGPMASIPAADRAAFIDSCLELIAFGLVART